MALEQICGQRDGVGGDEASVRTESGYLPLDAFHHLGIVSGHQVRHEDGHLQARAAALGHLLGEAHRAEERAAGVREVVDDQHTVSRLEGLLFSAFSTRQLVKQLRLLLGGLADPDLLDVQDVVGIELEPLDHRLVIPGVGAVVREQDEGVAAAGVVPLRLVLVQKVGHEPPHLHGRPEVGDGVAHRHLFVELNKQELQRRSPQRVQGHAVQRLVRTRQRRHRAGRGQQPRHVLRGGTIQPLPVRLVVGPLALGGDGPPAGALHLARAVPRQDHGDV
mmetsp:Transcript_68975/g.194699  ORF Transcript_68975/g.194699 Transcript_68975/m.194699 type:complete len:277 (-) Transcript_68975:665-1495(-)